MRVVFVSWKGIRHPAAGGSEIVVDRLLRGLAAKGHDVALICGGPVNDLSYNAVSSGGKYDQYLRAPLEARKLAPFDLLVDVSNGLPHFSPVWWHGPKLCMFHHVHAGQWHLQFPHGLAELGAFVERRFVPAVYKSTTFATVSPSTADALQSLGIDREAISIVRLGIDDRLFEPSLPTSEETTFLVLSRLAPNKSIRRVLEAWTNVRAATGGRLLIAGDGPERAMLEREAPDGVEFLGHVSEDKKRDLLGSACLMIHTAEREGWCLAIMEAAAQGTPTLAFRVDGVRDSVVDGATGVLVDTPEQLEKSWIALAHDPMRLARLGAAARERALEYTWDRSLDDFLAAATRAVERRR